MPVGTVGHSQSASGSVWSCRAREAKVVQMEKCCWRSDVFSYCPKRHELKEPVVQLKMSFRISRVVLTLLSALFLLHQTTREAFC